MKWHESLAKFLKDLFNEGSKLNWKATQDAIAGDMGRDKTPNQIKCGKCGCQYDAALNKKCPQCGFGSGDKPNEFPLF